MKKKSNQIKSEMEKLLLALLIAWLAITVKMSINIIGYKQDQEDQLNRRAFIVYSRTFVGCVMGGLIEAKNMKLLSHYIDTKGDCRILAFKEKDEYLANAKKTSSKKEVVDDTTLTYTKDAKPVFLRNCLPCHDNPSPMGLPTWLDYNTAYANRYKIMLRVWERRDMPLGKDMPESDRKLIKDWIDQGSKE